MERVKRKGKPSTLLVETKIGTRTMENSMKLPLKP